MKNPSFTSLSGHFPHFQVRSSKFTPLIEIGIHGQRQKFWALACQQRTSHINFSHRPTIQESVRIFSTAVQKSLRYITAFITKNAYPHPKANRHCRRSCLHQRRSQTPALALLGRLKKSLRQALRKIRQAKSLRSICSTVNRFHPYLNIKSRHHQLTQPTSHHGAIGLAHTDANLILWDRFFDKIARAVDTVLATANPQLLRLPSSRRPCYATTAWINRRYHYTPNPHPL